MIYDKAMLFKALALQTYTYELGERYLAKEKMDVYGVENHIKRKEHSCNDLKWAKMS
ncbi:hypothetical protein [Caldanaerobius fijiensis]|uniref:hypothetical protein n=1 Tax=Caldanaerobius fijiensis TaxID=456330 RepID=UPI00135637E1|nr:hypothetical protein [Caldanaerobius fijiensis]